jgi:preprotein translocase subunit SecD
VPRQLQLQADAASPSASPTASESPAASATPEPSPTPTVSVAPELLVPPIQSPDGSGDFADRFAALNCAESDILNGSTDDPAQYLISCEKDGSVKYALAPADLLVLTLKAQLQDCHRLVAVAGK